MKHVVVTGGAGFIGSHLCDQFLAQGYAVTAIDNLITGVESNLSDARKNKNFRFLKHDVCDPLKEEKLELMGEHGIHGLLHFACPASPVDFEKIPFDILKVDSLGTYQTVDFAMKHGARYLLASTSEVYGDPEEHPQTETYWGNVNSIGKRACYDETKRFAEAYVSSAMRGLGTYEGKPFEALNAAIVRIFNTYGPRMRPDDGRIIPEFCTRALRGEPLQVHGDGKQTRSYCYVSDLVEGTVALFESKFNDVFNVGNPIERTVIELVQAMEKSLGKKFDFETMPARADDPQRRCPNISKVKEKLGWEPKVDLDQGLSQTIEFFKSVGH